MAKTRAQRKAERRAREAEQARKQQGADGEDAQARAAETKAQHDTQVPVSGDVAEFEASIDTQSAPPDSPQAPAPSRADTPAPAAPPEPKKKSRRELRRERKEQEERDKKQRESEARLKGEEPAEERQRGAVIGFLASCWAELKKVQWPDRDTLVQASAVTLVFVAVLAAYLGVLDAGFNWLIKRII